MSCGTQLTLVSTARKLALHPVRKEFLGLRTFYNGECILISYQPNEIVSASKSPRGMIISSLTPSSLSLKRLKNYWASDTRDIDPKIKEISNSLSMEP